MRKEEVTILRHIKVRMKDTTKIKIEMRMKNKDNRACTQQYFKVITCMTSDSAPLHLTSFLSYIFLKVLPISPMYF